MIRQSFDLLGFKSFRTAEGISELLEEASFVNTQSTVERLPVGAPPGHSDGGVLGEKFTELLLLTLDLIQGVDRRLRRPHQPSRKSMIREIRASLSSGGNRRMDFMNLVRIRAQKPGGQ